MTTADRFDPDSYRLAWKRSLEAADAPAVHPVADSYVGKHRGLQLRWFSLRALFYVARHRHR